MKRDKTTIKRSGKTGFTISFSEKDGKALADHINKGGSLNDLLNRKPKEMPGPKCDGTQFCECRKCEAAKNGFSIE